MNYFIGRSLPTFASENSARSAATLSRLFGGEQVPLLAESPPSSDGLDHVAAQPGVPIDVVSDRVTSSVRVIEEHYDKPDQREAMEERRRQHLGRLEFNGGDDDD